MLAQNPAALSVRLGAQRREAVLILTCRVHPARDRFLGCRGPMGARSHAAVKANSSVEVCS